MKILLEIYGAGLASFEAQPAESLKELSAFAAKLAKSVTRGPLPGVTAVVIEPGQVLVNADQLLKIQAESDLRAIELQKIRDELRRLKRDARQVPFPEI